MSEEERRKGIKYVKISLERPYVDESLIKKVDKLKNDQIKNLLKHGKKIYNNTWFCWTKFLIYNGKKFIPITISEDMVGHKLDVAPTRQFFGHTPADKKAKAEETKTDKK